MRETCQRYCRKSPQYLLTPLSQQPVCLHIDCRALQLAMQAPVAEPAVLFVQLAMHTFCSPLHAIGAACIVSAHN